MRNWINQLTSLCRCALILLLGAFVACDQAVTPTLPEDRVELRVAVDYGGIQDGDTTLIHIESLSTFPLFFGRCCSHVQMGMQRHIDSAWVDYPVGLNKPCAAFCENETNPIGPDSMFTDKAALHQRVEPGLHRLVIEYWSDNPMWTPESTERQPFGTSTVYSDTFVVK